MPNSVASKHTLINIMTGPNPNFEGYISLPNGKVSYREAWADVADALFANCIPSSGDATTARAAFITAMANAAQNSNHKTVIENAFLAYIQDLESAMPVGSFITPVRPVLREVGEMVANMASLESSDWAIDVVAQSLITWAISYTATSVPAITGTTTIYKGTVAGTSQLANALAGGTWSSETTATATISVGGLVTAVAAGTTLISYEVDPNEFDLDSGATATAIVTVVTLPAITGASTVAVSATIDLDNTITGGTWATSNAAKATVDSSTGVVTGVDAGSCNITYTMPDGAQVTHAITVTA